jgi:hypothetical protein
MSKVIILILDLNYLVYIILLSKVYLRLDIFIFAHLVLQLNILIV